MQEIQNAFFCTRPYQIISAILLAESFGEKSDIYVLDYFEGAKTYAERLKASHIFNQVIVVDKLPIENLKIGRSIWAQHIIGLVRYISIDRYVTSVLYPNTRYKKIFTSCTLLLSRTVHLYYTKHNVKAELVYYDDGLGSYVRALIEPSRLDRLVRRILFGKKAIREIERPHQFYLYSPLLYEKINGEKANLILRSIHWKTDTSFRSQISEIFAINKDDLISEQVIIMDGPKDSESEIDASYDLYSILQGQYGQKNVIIKKHPTGDPEKPSFKYYKKTGVPFEALCAISEMSDKILVTVSSTAVITPKILTNQEPTIILLYKLLPSPHWDEAFKKKLDDFFGLFSRLYTRPDKIFIPGTVGDLIYFAKDHG